MAADPTDAQASFNPIIELQGMDPTALWQTAHKEFRFHGGGCTPEGLPLPGARVYGSLDMKTWQPTACVPMPEGCRSPLAAHGSTFTVTLLTN